MRELSNCLALQCCKEQHGSCANHSLEMRFLPSQQAMGSILGQFFFLSQLFFLTVISPIQLSLSLYIQISVLQQKPTKKTPKIRKLRNRMTSLNEKIIMWAVFENSDLFQLKMCKIVYFSWGYIFIQNKAQFWSLCVWTQLKEDRE